MAIDITPESIAITFVLPIFIDKHLKISKVLQCEIR